MYKITDLKLTNFWSHLKEFRLALSKAGQNKIYNKIGFFLIGEDSYGEKEWLELVELIFKSFQEIRFVSEVFDYTDAERIMIENIKPNDKQLFIDKIMSSNRHIISFNNVVFGEVHTAETETIETETTEEEAEEEAEEEDIEAIWYDWYHENYDDELDIDWDAIEYPKEKLNTIKFGEVWEQEWKLDNKLSKKIYEDDDYEYIPTHERKKLEKKLVVVRKKLLMYGKKLDRLQFECYVRQYMECSFKDFNDSNYKIDPRIPYKKEDTTDNI